MNTYFVKYATNPNYTYDRLPTGPWDVDRGWGTLVDAETPADAVKEVMGDSSHDYVKGKFLVVELTAIGLTQHSLEVVLQDNLVGEEE